MAIILAPDLIIKWFDGDRVGSTHFMRLLGAALIGFGVTNWIYSKSKSLEAVLPAIYGNLVSLSLATFVDIIDLTVNMLNRASWLILGLHVVFASAFTYCIILIKKSDVLTQN